jgi:hypothetical protein
MELFQNFRTLRATSYWRKRNTPEREERGDGEKIRLKEDNMFRLQRQGQHKHYAHTNFVSAPYSGHPIHVVNDFWPEYPFQYWILSSMYLQGWDMRTKKLATREHHFFSLQASIVALWIPCIVGKRSYTFTVTSITSTTLRTLAFILSFVLAIFNLVPDNPFLLYCSPPTNASQAACYNIRNCFSNVSLQKLRVCDQTIEDPVFTTALVGTTGRGQQMAICNHRHQPSKS